MSRCCMERAGGGMSFDQVVERVEAYISRMKTLFVLENLDNLRKNGRLTKMQSLITGALRVKLLCGATREGEISGGRCCHLSRSPDPPGYSAALSGRRDPPTSGRAGQYSCHRSVQLPLRRLRPGPDRPAGHGAGGRRHVL